MKIRAAGSIRILLAAFLLAGAGCAKQRVSTSPPVAVAGGERLLVMPFVDMTTRYAVGATVRSPVTGLVFQTRPVDPDAVVVLNDFLLEALRTHTTFQLIGSTGTGETGVALMEMRESGKSEIQVLTHAGRTAGADHVMAGYAYAFRERLGGSFSIEAPASVAFELHLIRVADERVLWSSHYSETQLSLSENLLDLGTFIDRGGRWVTAAEMARPAMDQMLSNLVTP